MKLAIKKIEFVPAAKFRSFRHLSANSYCNINSLLLSGEFIEIDHTQETFSLTEEWTNDSSGKFSTVDASFSIRSYPLISEPFLFYLSRVRTIFRLTACNGEKMIIGSPEFRANITFKKQITGLSTYEFLVTITCKSTHGIIYDTTE